MYLVDFGLDLPYIKDEERVAAIMEENNCPYECATRLDYQERWKEKRHLFGLETRCICSMFRRLSGKIKTEDCRKILVECMDHIRDERVLCGLGVCTVQVQSDFSSYAASNDHQKKEYALCVLMNGIIAVAEAKGWDIGRFETVKAEIIEADYNNEWVWTTVSSRNRRFRAELLLQHEVKYIDISIVLRDNSGAELARERIIREHPSEWQYVQHLGKLTWLSVSEVALVSKDGTRTWAVNFERFIKL